VRYQRGYCKQACTQAYQHPTEKKKPKFLVDDAAIIDPAMIDFKEYTLMMR
jgi:hypothetical protein